MSKKNMIWIALAAVVAYLLWKKSKSASAPLALTLPGVAGGTTFNPLDPLSTATAIADATNATNAANANTGIMPPSVSGSGGNDDLYGPQLQGGGYYTDPGSSVGDTPPIIDRKSMMIDQM